MELILKFILKNLIQRIDHFKEVDFDELNIMSTLEDGYLEIIKKLETKIETIEQITIAVDDLFNILNIVENKKKSTESFNPEVHIKVSSMCANYVMNLLVNNIKEKQEKTVGIIKYTVFSVTIFLFNLLNKSEKKFIKNISFFTLRIALNKSMAIIYKILLFNLDDQTKTNILKLKDEISKINNQVGDKVLSYSFAPIIIAIYVIFKFMRYSILFLK